jgi:hypothetical protein
VITEAGSGPGVRLIVPPPAGRRQRMQRMRASANDWADKIHKKATSSRERPFETREVYFLTGSHASRCDGASWVSSSSIQSSSSFSQRATRAAVMMKPRSVAILN